MKTQILTGNKKAASDSKNTIDLIYNNKQAITSYPILIHNINHLE